MKDEMLKCSSYTSRQGDCLTPQKSRSVLKGLDAVVMAANVNTTWWTPGESELQMWEPGEGRGGSDDDDDWRWFDTAQHSTQQTGT
mmetsp:Transcript_33716/g.40733  ORF Transcript_33716/g.40733 Transcript_33716/m.40733 type:complete len:86 (+) Transcript_33716:2649-2906(+)